jgi:tricarballylate dehydrogenase
VGETLQEHIHGHWSGSHSVAWDINAPPYGDLTVGAQFQKHNYRFGILINAKGERYVDEGANFHSHTYAKYGGEIIKLPGMFACRVSSGPEGNRLCRGPERGDRIPLGGGAIRSTAGVGGRVG